MLFGKGDTDNGDEEDGSADQMYEGDLPTKKNQPDYVENDIKQTAGFGVYNDLFSEGRKIGYSQFKGLDAKGNADNGDTPEYTTDKVADACQQATEN